MDKIIEIKCESNNYAPLDAFNELQGNLKDLNELNFNKLKLSILNYGFVAPLFVWKDNKGKLWILDAHQRCRVLKHLRDIDGYDIPNLPYNLIHAKDKRQAKEILLAINSSYGKMTVDGLYEFANELNFELDMKALEVVLELPMVNLDMFNVNEYSDKNKEIDTNEAHNSLSKKFIIPPFSILDTRQGYWIERKKYWSALIGDYGESRENALAGISGFENVDYANGGFNNNVSLLDPVLSEIINLWFGLPNGKTFDCFAGDSVFGYVSSYLGNNFTGIELRKEQSEINNLRIKEFSKSKYICDDGQNVLNHIAENSQDLLFSCPPYFDLEVYSDLENDASNQKDYKDFLQILDNAFTSAIKCLKNNRFAVITVGDIRDKKGFYYRFVDDIKDIFKKNNVLLYNELILVNSLGTLPFRVSRYMANRKIGKTHQNVLVFYKGDPAKIKEIYPILDFSEIENESADI